MYFRSTTHLGHIIRERRLLLGLTQRELAARVGVTRQWLIGIEQGKADARIGLVLRTLEALGLRLNATPEETLRSAPSDVAVDLDVDAVIERARKRSP